MKITCDIIEDLLPLYVEGLTSDDTQKLVEEHLNTCTECKKRLNAIQNPKQIPIDTNVEPFKKVERRLFKKRIQIIALTIILVLAIVIISMAYLTSPEYLPYSNDIVSLTAYEDGKIIITFDDKVTGYDIDRYVAEDNAGYVYHLTTWSTIWSQYILKNNTQSIILNPDGEDVAAVYYYFTDGRDDILIYGKDLHKDGGVVTLPRLVLAYYILIAMLLAILCGIFLFIYRKEDKRKYVLKKILLLPISYIIGHFCIKGFSATSYSAQRDFFAILLATIPIYCLFLLFINLYNKSKNRD
ncbi:MAG: zf-HC2 domain-containing protein [Clostridia bacterium]|nr:zf-HC2 domain-containing protein [Clostridia bacterium]